MQTLLIFGFSVKGKRDSIVFKVKKVKLEILGLSPSQSQQGSFALVLGEELGARRLPIIIGVFEAQAIAVQMEAIAPNRPMTHDLFKSFAAALKFTVKEIVISDLREGIFFAQIICGDDITNVEIDARPSDAIAIGLRFDAPIYVAEKILDEAGIVSTPAEPDVLGEEVVSEPHLKGSFLDQIRGLSTEKLQSMLEEALQNEEYEKAAQLRDELGRRN
ncbi:bifunctional nuclease family protein [Ravibacter arvi]|uniref:Bifunctional nuclease family protein n=1 Tax=Ravibacter arvi TaxID=2051041 RepID=A0ABP8LXN6_9BACT